MIFFAYDTETTGIPLFDQPSNDIRQPHLVQVAWSLFDITDESLPTINVRTVRPDGWEISPEMTAIHGISHEFAMSVGLPEEEVIGEFIGDWRNDITRIAHNESFDARMLRIAIMRFLPGRENHWAAGKSECTAKASTQHCCLPPSDKMRAKGMKFYKTPKLQEAHEKLIGRKFDGAHNAFNDVEALITVARKLYQLGEFR